MRKDQVRMIYGDGEGLPRMDHVNGNRGKVFAVIGPFDGHMDKMELQRALESVNGQDLGAIMDELSAMRENNERNARVQARYDDLMREGKHGHYETMFRVVREEN